MRRERKKGLIHQVYLVAVFGMITIGIFTYLTQYLLVKSGEKSDIEDQARMAVREAGQTIKEYPAYSWLLSYWAEHADELDIEYDADFAGNTETRKKCELLAEHHPELQLRYCSEDEVAALEEEDQKLYAEIVYTWIITRLDRIKQAVGCNYLFVVMTDTDEGEKPYDKMLFLMSGADPGAVRGTEYEQVYTLGVTMDVDQTGTRNALRAAVEAAQTEDGGENISGEKTKDSGKYLDLYSALEIKDGKAVLTGVTFYQGDMLKKTSLSTLWHTLLTVAYQVLLISVVIRRIIIFMLRPLEKVLAQIRRYTVSKDSKEAEESLKKVLSGRHAIAVRENEIGQLTDDFIDLTKEIDDYTKQIEAAAAAREKIGLELEVAAKIQSHMLPDAHPLFPDHPQFLLSASMTPAKEVGGDFYDYFFVDENHLALVMADVSDKGIPSALFMAQAKALIKGGAKSGEEPARILSLVNSQLNENNEEGYFVTVWLAVIDLATGKGLVANAGHEHPVLCRRGGSFELVIYKHNMALGMIEDVSFRQHEFTLYPGDRLFVYTDGVPEATNISDEQFGTGRMLEVLNESREAEPKELLDRMGAAVDQFTGDACRFDDTTMMCLYYKDTEE